ncbi:MAG: hypothetical protein J1E02_07300 [Coprobacter sp.]|nr:hypothetical protein [Coprobacter sp.]
MKVTDIITRTLELLGEINPLDTESELSPNSLPAEGLIVSYLDQAVEDVFLQAPAYTLPWCELPGPVVPHGDGSGHIVLPDDCMGRFVIRLHGWRREVTRVITPDDALYALQRNPVTRGGTERPVCVSTVDDEGRPVLEYYSLPVRVRNPSAEKMLYVRRVTVPRSRESYAGYEIGGSPRLLTPVAVRCAYYVSLSLGNAAMTSWCEQETTKQILRL